MHWGAAAGVSPGEQCLQQQEAECQRQAAGCGTLGGQRGGVCRLGLAAYTWAPGFLFSSAGPRWFGRHSAGLLFSPALTRRTNFFSSRSWAAARRVRGVAGGAEARAGCGAGRASARAADLACLESKLVNLRPVEKYKHILDC